MYTRQTAWLYCSFLFYILYNCLATLNVAFYTSFIVVNSNIVFNFYFLIFLITIFSLFFFTKDKKFFFYFFILLSVCVVVVSIQLNFVNLYKNPLTFINVFALNRNTLNIFFDFAGPGLFHGISFLFISSFFFFVFVGLNLKYTASLYIKNKYSFLHLNKFFYFLTLSNYILITGAYWAYYSAIWANWYNNDLIEVFYIVFFILNVYAIHSNKNKNNLILVYFYFFIFMLAFLTLLRFGFINSKHTSVSFTSLFNVFNFYYLFVFYILIFFFIKYWVFRLFFYKKQQQVFNIKVLSHSINLLHSYFFYNYWFFFFWNIILFFFSLIWLFKSNIQSLLIYFFMFNSIYFYFLYSFLFFFKKININWLKIFNKNVHSVILFFFIFIFYFLWGFFILKTFQNQLYGNKPNLFNYVNSCTYINFFTSQQTNNDTFSFIFQKFSIQFKKPDWTLNQKKLNVLTQSNTSYVSQNNQQYPFNGDHKKQTLFFQKLNNTFWLYTPLKNQLNLQQCFFFKLEFDSMVFFVAWFLILFLLIFKLKNVKKLINF